MENLQQGKQGKAFEATRWKECIQKDLLQASEDEIKKERWAVMESKIKRVDVVQDASRRSFNTVQ